jgi:hypothetical protein
MAMRGHPEMTARQNLPPGTDDLVGATDMVDGVRLDGIRGAASVPSNGAKTPGGKFSVDDGATPLTHNARLSTMAGIDLESMLALQTVDEAAERDRSARKRGTAMIAALTKLQHTMLAEEDPSSALVALQDLTIDGAVADDPELDAILRAVDLRSRVEIARRQRRAC